jgi:hypothetical protein
MSIREESEDVSDLRRAGNPISPWADITGPLTCCRSLRSRLWRQPAKLAIRWRLNPWVNQDNLEAIRSCPPPPIVLSRG